MDAERWQKIKSLLEEVLEIPAESRSAFLEKSCNGDTDLQNEIEKLLVFEESASELLEQEIVSAVLGNQTPTKNLIGQQIGKYRIIDELGAGGMGTVYLAERADGEFEQKVALKLIKGGMNTEAILRHFFNERQILASLEHPNIARLIDGGTTDEGLPFFIMEFVEGEPINEYAEKENLGLEEKLDLFREVCTAVSFAHRNLVIHRDLKPSNILITREGKVKLLDFGIAKLLKSETNEAVTATKNFIFTPEYASPEQIRGDKLTTATDVYSLGVILYELLTGSRPFKTEGENISEIIKAVCETEAVRPSSVLSSKFKVQSSSLENKTSQNKNRSTEEERKTTNPKSKIQNLKSLKGDLDNITLKAIRKEPERRYESVEQFSEDIRRHLKGLPVSARQDTWNYRASKFFHRNKAATAAVFLAILSLLGGLTATIYQANKAQRRFNDVRQLAGSFLFEFHDAIENLPGSTAARELVVKRSLEYLDKLAAESGGDADLERDLAAAYEKVGKIQGNSYYANLGDTEGALKSYKKSLELREKLFAADPNNQDLQHELANSLQGVGDMLYTVGTLKEGLSYYEKTLAIRAKLNAGEPNNLKYREGLAETYTRLGDIKGLEGYPNLGDTLGSLKYYKKAVEIGENLVKTQPENPSFKSSLAIWKTSLGMLQSTTGDNRSAIENGQNAVKMFKELIAANPDNSQYQTNLLLTYNFIRFPLTEEMRFEEATEMLLEAIESLNQQIKVDPKNAFAKRAISVSFNSLGKIQTASGNYSEAIKNHQKSLEIVEKLVETDKESVENRRDLALTLEFLAEAQLKADETQAALDNYRKSLELIKKEDDEDSSTDTSNIYLGIGRSLAATGNLDEAAKTFLDAEKSAFENAGKSPVNVKTQVRLAIFYLEGGKVFKKLSTATNGEQKTRNLRLAKEWLDKSQKIWNELKRTDKLSKLNADYPNETAKILNDI